jgi:hypothetical protein
VTNMCALIQNFQAPLNGFLYIGNSFCFCFSLGMTAWKSRATHVESTILQIWSQYDFKSHTFSPLLSYSKDTAFHFVTIEHPGLRKINLKGGAMRKKHSNLT